MTSVFLQVRLDSSRLPRKALALLGGRTVVQRCFDALDAVDADLRVLVTEPASAPELAPLARASGWEVFVGPKDDVLGRFVAAARATRSDTIVRATGDNPLVSARLANLALGRHRAADNDYTAFDGAPLGTGVEVLRAAALFEAADSQPDDYEREHVSPFLYRRPDRFRIDRSPAPEGCLAPGRVTLDTAEDLAHLVSLWEVAYRGSPPEVEDLIPWLNPAS